jgi:hypothetical protein
MKKNSKFGFATVSLLLLNQCTTNQCAVQERYAQNILAQIGISTNVSPARILNDALWELNKCPKPSPSAQTLMAKCHYDLGILVEDSSYNQAARHYMNAVRLADSADATTLNAYQHALARAYIGVHDLDKAEKILKRISKKLIEFPLLEGRLFYNKTFPPYNGGKKELNLAIDAFKNLTENKKTPPALRATAYYEAGMAYWKLEDLKNARRHFDSVQFTSKLPVEAYYDMASFRLATGDTMRAKQLLDNGLGYNMQNADYMYYYGKFELEPLRKKYEYNRLTAYQRTERDNFMYKSGLESFKKAYVKSNRKSLSVNICKSMIWAESWANAVPTIPMSGMPDSLLSDDNSELAFYAGLAARNEGKFEKALMLFKKVSDNKYLPNNIRSMSCFQRGLLEKEGDVNVWNQAIKLYPNYPDALYKRGEYYTDETLLADTNKVNHYAEALQDFHSVLNLNPQFWQVYLDRGTIYSEKKQYDNALSDFDFLIKNTSNLANETHKALKINANLGKGVVLYRRSRETFAQKNDRKEAINCFKYVVAECDTIAQKGAYERRRFTATYYLYELYSDKQNEETFKYYDYLKQNFEKFKTESELTVREKRIIKAIEVRLGQMLEAFWVNPMISEGEDTIIWHKKSLEFKLRIQSFYKLTDFELKLDHKIVDKNLPPAQYVTNFDFPKDTTYKFEISLKNKEKEFKKIQYITVDTKSDTFQFNRKYALVIGNNSYTQWGALNNAVNDGKEVKLFLEKAGFRVRFEENLDGQKLKTVLASLQDSSENYDLTLLYYAGHGFNTGGSNYLVPTDCPKDAPKTYAFDTKSLFQNMYSRWAPRAKMAKGKAFIWLFDACREQIGDDSDYGNLKLDLNRERLLPNTIILSTAPLGKTVSDKNPCITDLGNFVPRLRVNFDASKPENVTKEVIQLFDTKSVNLCPTDEKMVPVILSNLSVKIVLLSETPIVRN